MKHSKCILVTGCGGPLGVNITRSLKMAPEPLRVVGTECNHYHLPLSLADASHLIPPAKSLAAYRQALASIVEREHVEMILPTHPFEVQTISIIRGDFPAVRFYLPEHETILVGQDKWKTYEALLHRGLPVPETRFLGTVEDVKRCFDEIVSRPIWVRGSGTPGAGIGVASLPCRTVDHALAWIDYWKGFGFFIASEFLPGRNLTWCGMFQGGILLAAQSRERLEYVIPHVSPSGITGAPAVSRTVRRDDVHETGEAAVRAIASVPHGIFFVDFKEDAHGIARVTEINVGRFGTTIHFYTEAGFNFPYLAVRAAFEEPLAPLLPTIPTRDPISPGVYWLRTLDCGPVLVKGLDGEA